MKNNLVMINNQLYVTDNETFFRMTFNPETEFKFFFTLEVNGKTYNERKSDIEDKAHILQDAQSEYSGLSIMEYMILDNFFETNGKRYGLYREFKENAIC